MNCFIKTQKYILQHNAFWKNPVFFIYFYLQARKHKSIIVSFKVNNFNHVKLLIYSTNL